MTLPDVRPHPAKFSQPILDELRRLTATLPDGARVLDPFAGVGLIHTLDRFDTVGVELEPEWASQHERTVVGDSRFLTARFDPESFDAVVTSCSYGNRMADAYAGDPKGSRRVTYRIHLGRPLTEGSGAGLQWRDGRGGDAYRALHEQVWAECFAVLKPGGKLFLNVSDHIRDGRVQHVVDWHFGALERAGFKVDAKHRVETQRMRMGANGDKRVNAEAVLVAVKPEGGQQTPVEVIERELRRSGLAFDLAEDDAPGFVAALEAAGYKIVRA